MRLGNVLWFVLWSVSSWAQSSHLELNTANESGWLILGLAGQVSGQRQLTSMEPSDLQTLSKEQDLWAIDRPFAGTYSQPLALTSDVMILSLGLVPACLDLWNVHGDRSTTKEAITDMVVLGETLVLGSALNLWTRSLRVHPRPLVYAESAPLDSRVDPEAAGSFYSGHASGAFALAGFIALKAADAQSGSGWKTAVIPAYLAATTIALLRLGAGRHYPSDVAVGALMGTAVSWMVYRLHERKGAGLNGAEIKTGGKDVSIKLAWTF